MRCIPLLPAGVMLFAADHTKRVKRSWEMSGGFGAGASGGTGAGAGRVSGGARPQTVEVMNTC
jgi:hypothetical protein